MGRKPRIRKPIPSVSEINLKTLKAKMKREIENKVLKSLIQTAIVNNISIKDIEVKHKSYIEKIRDKYKQEIYPKYKDEFESLTQIVNKEREEWLEKLQIINAQVDTGLEKKLTMC